MNKFFLRHSFNEITLTPYSYITPSLASTSKGLLILLLPQIFMLFVTKSYSAVFVVLASTLASLSSEAITLINQKPSSTSWFLATVQGILIGMLLPETYPVLAVFVISFIALMLVKYASGGFSSSWANPVAAAVATAYFMNAAFFPAYQVSTIELQTRNAALNLIQNGTIPLISADTEITAFFNRTVFKLFGIAVPEGYVSLFWDNGAIIPAFRFNLITIISSIILISLDMMDYLIPAIFITIYALLIRFVSPFFVGGIPMQGDIMLALLTSGTLFGTLYLLQWYGTTPVTTFGKVIYAIIAGITAFFVIGFGTSPVGYVYMVLLMDLFSPLIQVIESRKAKHHIEQVLLPRMNAMKETENE